MKETDIMRLQRVAASERGDRLFRNNCALAWVGDEKPQIKHERDGSMTVVLRNARPLHAGLTKGSADLIGFKRVTITPDMAGSTIAVFHSAEIKKIGKKPDPDQVIWANLIREAGGIAETIYG